MKKNDADKYVRRAFYSAEDHCWVAIAPELPGCSALGDSPEEATEELRTAIQLHLEMRLAHRDRIPKPTATQEMGGRLLLRLPKALQRTLKEDAAEEGVSVNQYALFLIASARAQLKTRGYSSYVSDAPRKKPRDGR